MGLGDWLGRLLGLGARAPAGSALPAPPPQQGAGVEELARRLGLSIEVLRQTPVQYHQFTIPKRHSGTRTIMAPAPELKALQRRILRRLLAKLRVHPAAMGFEKGRSIATHALLHSGRAIVVRLDLEDFFPATQAERVRHYFRVIGWNAEAADELVRLCTYAGGLPQGAPTSPRLSNLVNRGLDVRLAGLARSFSEARALPALNPKTLAPAPREAVPLEVYYTRYADDLTFSLSRDHSGAVGSLIFHVKAIMAEFGYRVHVHRKLRIMRRHDRQMVTGLVVNEFVALPRQRRRWLRAVEHRLAHGKAATLSPEQLAGWRALQRMIVTQTTAAPPGDA